MFQLCAFCLATMVVVASSIAIYNGVSGTPQIQCGTNTVKIEFQVLRNFHGRVYVKGYADIPTCQGKNGRLASSVAIEIDVFSCGMQRIRSANPAGVYISAIFVMSFHPKFITGADKAFRIQCFYMEASKSVSAQLDVSMLPTILATVSHAMPKCRYDLLSGGFNGTPVRYGRVGQPIYHKWSCDAEEQNMFCMVVHSCEVNDGRGDIVQVIDGDGCSLDPYLIGNLEYIDSLTAGIEAHVFKYSDRALVFFTCQIAVTVKPEEPCQRPICGSYDKAKRIKRRLSSALPKEGERVANIDVSTNEVQLVDKLNEYDDRLADESIDEIVRLSDVRRGTSDIDHLGFESVTSESRFCIDSAGATIVMTAVTVLCLFSLTIALFALLARSSAKHTFRL